MFFFRFEAVHFASVLQPCNLTIGGTLRAIFMFNQSWPVLWISIDVISFHSTRFSLSEEKRRKEKPPSMSLDPSVSSTPSPSEVLAPLHIGCAVVTGNESNKKKEMRFEVYTVFSSPVSLPIVSRPLQVFPFFFFIFSFLLRWWLASVMSRRYVMPDITDFRGWFNDRFFDVDVGRGVVYLRPDWRGGRGALARITRLMLRPVRLREPAA